MNPVVHQITKTVHQIKYHEQILPGNVVPDRIKTTHVLGTHVPDRPNMSFSLEKSTLWSTVSNAADRSRRTSNTNLL